jgi:hypothetical protein
VTGAPKRAASNGFARARSTDAARRRDPLGKAALFSGSGAPNDADSVVVHDLAPGADAALLHEGRGASHLFSHTEAKPGTVVLECSTCAQSTRVSYAEFAALHFPVWAWVPSPRRSHRHWLRCPACGRFTWLRAAWFE